MRINLFLLGLSILAMASCKEGAEHYDTIIRNAMIYDGNGGDPFRGDLAIRGDTIAFIGNLENASAKNVVDAGGRALSPGFVNMLSWAPVDLIEDGRSQSDIRQGVTLEVFGEGSSMGPLNEKMKDKMQDDQPDIKYKVEWKSLSEYLNFIEKKGISCNVASFIGAGTLREYAVGEDNRPATPAELDTMRRLVSEEMKGGAMGIGSSLIYPPDAFANTDELVAICSEAGKYGGSYISHMRSEGNRLTQAVEELINIAKRANVHAEIYHLKAAGKNNWNKMDSVISRIEKARNEGLNITADMYCYTAGATGLTAALPPTLQDGGFGKLWERLHDKKIREDMKKAMLSNPVDWENLYSGAGGAQQVLLLGFRRDSLRKYLGKTLAAVAKERHSSPEETALNLIVEDSSRIEVAYFLMDENNVKKQISLPWVSFCSDAGSTSPEGVFLHSHPHPRQYGNFIRVLGKYARDEKVLTLQAAIKKLSKLPATNLKIKNRGELKTGNDADLVLFDPASVKDNATYENPQQFADGVKDVWVNGVQVLKDGAHSGEKPGRFVKGPGYQPAKNP
jgi:N-acyl-D-amino-acid deacylase